MEIISIKQTSPDPKVIAHAAEILRAGGVVAHPTDTCYGLAADIRNPVAIEKVFRIKRIEKERSLSIMVASLEQAEQYGVFNETARKLALHFLPGPLTLVVPRIDTARSLDRAYRLPSANMYIGIRIPKCALSLALVTANGAPLTTTSANPTGEKTPFSGEMVNSYFSESPLAPDLLLDGGPLSTDAASTVVQVTDEVKCLREGAIPWESIQKYI